MAGGGPKANAASRWKPSAMPVAHLQVRSMRRQAHRPLTTCGTSPPAPENRQHRRHFTRPNYFDHMNFSEVTSVATPRLTKTSCCQSTSMTSMRPTLAQATGLLPDYDKCQAYIADVH